MKGDSCGSIDVFPVPVLQRTKSSVLVEEKKGFYRNKKNLNHQSGYILIKGNRGVQTNV